MPNQWIPFFAAVLLIGSAILPQNTVAAIPSGTLRVIVSNPTNHVWDVAPFELLQRPTLEFFSDETLVSFSAPFVQTGAGRLAGAGDTGMDVSSPFFTGTPDASYKTTGRITSSRGVARLAFTSTAKAAVFIEGTPGVLSATLGVNASLNSTLGTVTWLSRAVAGASRVVTLKESGALPLDWTNVVAVLGDGSWSLDLRLTNDTVKKVGGIATVTLSTGAELSFKAKGVYTAKKDSTVLVLAPDLASKGSTLKVTLTGTNRAALVGKLSGQPVKEVGAAMEQVLTTVVGVVRDMDNAPVAGATVTVGALAMSGVTDAEGRFSIAGVSSGSGPLSVKALLERLGNLTLLASSEVLIPSPGGVMDAGVILARPVFPGLAYIPPGTFEMGSPTTELERKDDESQHTVTLTKFVLMGRHEVTQGEWLDVMGSNPSYFTNGIEALFPGTGQATTNDLRHPVEQVSWFDAMDYCARLTRHERLEGRIPGDYAFRLPTEAEWEYACRGGTTSAFNYGPALRSGMANFDGQAGYDSSVGSINNPDGIYLGMTAEVGGYEANGWGLSDMHGNVWEWCSDWYGVYPSAGGMNPVGPDTGFVRVIRGGGFRVFASSCRSAIRNGSYYSDFGYRNVGFRVVLASEQP